MVFVHIAERYGRRRILIVTANEPFSGSDNVSSANERTDVVVAPQRMEPAGMR